MLRTSLPLALALALAPACAPLPGDSESATEATESGSGSATESSSGSATEADTDGPTSTDADTEVATDTDGEMNSCPAADPAAIASYSIDLSAWPEVGGGNGEPPTINVAASCSVTFFTQEKTSIGVGLLCQQDAMVDMPVTISMSAPADLPVSLVVGLEVRLVAYWQGDGHHIGSGSWFAIHDESAEILLLAGVDLEGYSTAAANFKPLSFSQIDAVCEATCNTLECGDPNEDGDLRHVLRVTHALGGEILVGDGGRGLLGADGWNHDIIVDTAKDYFCINCGSSYRIVIGTTPWV